MANQSLSIAKSNTFSNHGCPDVMRKAIGNRTFSQSADGGIELGGTFTGRVMPEIPKSEPFENLKWAAVDPSTYARGA